MFMSEKPPQAISFYKEEEEQENPEEESRDNMIIEVPPPPQHHHSFRETTSNGGEDNTNNNNTPPTAAANHHPILSSNFDSKAAPKKRAETWVQEETRVLISLRREIDSLFNTTKSNKHLWDRISLKMRGKGFDRSPTMCTDKWRNLLKEFKKIKKQNCDRNGSPKMSCYKEIEEILKERSKTSSKVDSFMHFSDKGIDDTSIAFTTVEANGRQTLNLERRLDHDGHPLAITAADAVAASGVSPWNWRDNAAGDQSPAYEGRVISVKWGDYTKRIGIDGTAQAIKEAIKSAFGLRTNRAVWLEDEDNVIRALDRDMPLGNYTLHVDEGLTIKVCLYEESDHLPVHTEDMTFYTEENFRDFLSRRGWTCLREYNGYRNIDNMDELCQGAIYRGINMG